MSDTPVRRIDEEITVVSSKQYRKLIIPGFTVDRHPS
jgi:hypothetical protein